MNLTEIVNDIALANQKLAIMIGEPEDINIIPEPGILLDTNSKNYDQYLAEAFEHSYGIKISEKQTELSKLQLKEVKSNALPRIGLFAEYSYTYPQILFYPYANALYGLGQAGIKIFFPISSLYHNRHKENVAAIEIKKQELAHEDEKDVLRQQVKEAYVRYKESLTRIAVSEANIKQATENYRIVKNTYFNQLALLTDLMDADTQLLQSRFGFVSAQISAQLHYYQLQKTIGTL
jgi:outer membrane protein TolC